MGGMKAIHTLMILLIAVCLAAVLTGQGIFSVEEPFWNLLSPNLSVPYANTPSENGSPLLGWFAAPLQARTAIDLILGGLLLGGLLEFVRKRRLRRRLQSRNPDVVRACLNKLTPSPHNASLLVKRWIVEWDRIRSQQSDSLSTQPILQELQSRLDEMEHQESWRMAWRYVNLRTQFPKTIQWLHDLTSRITHLRVENRQRFERLLCRCFPLPWTHTFGARLENHHFQQDLGPIRLRYARMEGCTFQGIGMQGSDLRGCQLRRARFYQANLERGSLYQAFMPDSNLDEANLSHATLVGANLQRASLIAAYLEDADLRHADLEGAHFFQADLIRANLSKSNLKNASFLYAHLEKANLNSANLDRSELHFANLRGAKLDGAWLRQGNLPCADLNRATLRGTDLTLANFYEADLRWCDLTDIEWAGACFLNANLVNARAEDALLSYAFTQAAYMSEHQIDRIIDWNDEHPDAPWLKEDWEFWWEALEWHHGIDWRQPGFHFEEFAFEFESERQEIQSYLKEIWKGWS